MKISLKNAEKVGAALSASNGRATRHVIQNAAELREFAAAAEKKLERILPKSAWKGACAWCEPEGPWANAYKYAARSNRCRLERGATGWFLTDVEESRVYPKSKRRCDVRLNAVQTVAARRCALKRLALNFSLTELGQNATAHEIIEVEAAAAKLLGT